MEDKKWWSNVSKKLKKESKSITAIVIGGFVVYYTPLVWRRFNFDGVIYYYLMTAGVLAVIIILYKWFKELRKPFDKRIWRNFTLEKEQDE